MKLCVIRTNKLYGIGTFRLLKDSELCPSTFDDFSNKSARYFKEERGRHLRIN